MFKKSKADFYSSLKYWWAGNFCIALVFWLFGPSMFYELGSAFPYAFKLSSMYYTLILVSVSMLISITYILIYKMGSAAFLVINIIPFIVSIILWFSHLMGVKDFRNSDFIFFVCIWIYLIYNTLFIIIRYCIFKNRGLLVVS